MKEMNRFAMFYVARADLQSEAEKTEFMSDIPQMAAYGRHILICTGSFCDPEGKASRLYMRLAHKLGDLARYNNPERVKRGTTPCLGVCSGGPIIAVYPDGIWYHHVDEAVLDRIIEEHLRNGRPVEEYIFHRLSPQACSLE